MAKPRIGITPSCKNGNPHEQTLSPRYLAAVEQSGGEAVVLDMFTTAREMPALIKGLDGLIFSGGGDIDPVRFGQEKLPECGTIVPERDELELALMQAAMERDLPILGICRGIQVINVALGGTLLQDLPSAWGKAHRQAGEDIYWHPVDVVPGTLLHGIVQTGRMPTNSFHHQCVLDVAPGLTVSARAEDGVIEAVESASARFLLGVEWHPEISWSHDEYSKRIFASFIAHA